MVYQGKCYIAEKVMRKPPWTGVFPMKHTQEQCLDIARQVYDGETHELRKLWSNTISALPCKDVSKTLLC